MLWAVYVYRSVGPGGSFEFFTAGDAVAIFDNDFYGGAVGNRDSICKPGTPQTILNTATGYVITRYKDYDLNRSCNDIFIPETFGHDAVREASFDMHFDLDVKR